MSKSTTPQIPYNPLLFCYPNDYLSDEVALRNVASILELLGDRLILTDQIEGVNIPSHQYGFSVLMHSLAQTLSQIGEVQKAESSKSESTNPQVDHLNPRSGDGYKDGNTT